MPVYKLKGNRDFDLEVVGEAHYQSNFESICGQRKPHGENQLVEAQLILESNNQFDRNAVRVDVQGRTLGYLSREEAKEYRTVCSMLNVPESTVLVLDGQIRGGWLRENGDKGHYGLWLDFPSDIQNAIHQLKTISQKTNKKGCCGLIVFIPILTMINLLFTQ